jgi:hypothetical protein
MCGERALEQKTGEFIFKPPAMIPGGPIIVENSNWEECFACKKNILGDVLSRAIRAEAKLRNRK